MLPEPSLKAWASQAESHGSKAEAQGAQGAPAPEVTPKAKAKPEAPKVTPPGEGEEVDEKVVFSDQITWK